MLVLYRGGETLEIGVIRGLKDMKLVMRISICYNQPATHKVSLYNCLRNKVKREHSSMSNSVIISVSLPNESRKKYVSPRWPDQISIHGRDWGRDVPIKFSIRARWDTEWRLEFSNNSSVPSDASKNMCF